MNMLKRILGWCLCLALLAGAACAETVVQMPDYNLQYQCTLADGRMVLTGVQIKDKGEYTTSKALMVCLNPDGTVSWEYLGPEVGESLWFSRAAALQDGTIAATYDVYPYGATPYHAIWFFSADGEKLEKEIRLQDGPGFRDMPQTSFLITQREVPAGDLTEVRDWDGNKLVMFNEIRVTEMNGWWIEGDELTVYGNGEPETHRAKIVKMDGLTDQVLWSTTLDLQWPDSADASLPQAVKTADGGYAALLREQKSDWWSDEWTTRYALVKLDAGGNVQWISKLADKDDGEYSLCEYQGKIVVLYDPREEMDKPMVLRWFDGDGNKTSRSELMLKPEYFPKMAGKTAPKSKKIPRLAGVNSIELIPAADGLWAYVTAYLADYHKEDNELAQVDDSYDAIMIRVQEQLP